MKAIGFVLLAVLACTYTADAAITILRPTPSTDTLEADWDTYISWMGASTSYVDVYYQYTSSSLKYRITTTSYDRYYWRIPSYVSGYIQISVCNSGSSTNCGYSSALYVYPYQNTYVISPAAWVVPTIFAIVVIVAVLGCWRRRRCCFASRTGDLYVPVQGAVVVPTTDTYIVQPAVPVTNYATAQPYYPPQPQPVYQQPYVQPAQPYYQPH